MIIPTELLALPTPERLELAEMLRRSVGYPGDIETIPLPKWRLAGLERLLDRYARDETEA